ncbi:hypothetical protein L0F63_005249 [Massospora cicadina]|nr:hypothetical protein L0F63_005249 [Massospora cicadina]
MKTIIKVECPKSALSELSNARQVLLPLEDILVLELFAFLCWGTKNQLPGALSQNPAFAPDPALIDAHNTLEFIRPEQVKESSLVPPGTLQEEVIREAHDPPTDVHSDKDNTDCEDKAGRQEAERPLMALGESVSIDFIVEFPLSQGYDAADGEGLPAYQVDLPPLIKVFTTLLECLMTPFDGPMPFHPKPVIVDVEPKYEINAVLASFLSLRRLQSRHPSLLSRYEEFTLHKNFAFAYFPHVIADGDVTASDISPVIDRPSKARSNKPLEPSSKPLKVTNDISKVVERILFLALKARTEENGSHEEEKQAKIDL